MGNRNAALIVGILVMALLVAPGCVSKKMFRGNVEDTDGRVSSVESAVEANQRRLTDMKTDTDKKLSDIRGQADQAMRLGNDAMSKAQSAEAAALGKLLWTVTLTHDDVKFGFGRTELSSSAISALDGLSQKVKSYGKQLYLEIEGHTDNVGAESYNYDLGELRAMAVRNYLNEKAGIPLHAMSMISYGETRPVADNSSRGGREQNRRVVVRVLE